MKRTDGCWISFRKDGVIRYSMQMRPSLPSHPKVLKNIQMEWPIWLADPDVEVLVDERPVQRSELDVFLGKS